MASTNTQDVAQSPFDIGAILNAFWSRAWEGVTMGIGNIPKTSFGLEGGWPGMVMVGIGMLLILGALTMFMIEEAGKYKGEIMQVAKLAAGGI